MIDNYESGISRHKLIQKLQFHAEANKKKKRIKTEFQRRSAKESLEKYINYTFPEYEMTDFHKTMCQEVDDWIHNKTQFLRLHAPPQHGKSECSTVRGITYHIGLEPTLNYAIATYNKHISEDFYTEIVKVMTSPEYRKLFPDVTISAMEDVKNTDGRANSKRIDILYKGKKKGLLIFGKDLTGKKVDVLVVDDLYKNENDAFSAPFRKKIERWWVSEAQRRLHNKSKILMLFTRWHIDDIGGYEEKNKTYNWKNIIFEGIKTKDTIHNLYDPREIGEPLWPERHSLASLLKLKETNPFTFQCMYQQNPAPLEGLMYADGFKLYDKQMLKKLEELGAPIKSYTDTADTGKDFLSTFVYYEWENKAYIKDIIYTQKSMKHTIPLWAKKHKENNVNYALIEYNNGGHPFKLFAEEKLKKEHNYYGCKIDGFHQSQNKVARILSQSGWIQENVFFPENWHIIWSELNRDLVTYMKEGKNAHDDGPDALTGVAEMMLKKPRKAKAAKSIY